MKLLRILAAAAMFAGILAGCLALLLLVLLMVRFPPILIAVLASLLPNRASASLVSCSRLRKETMLP
ncbi:hypothetical protein CFY91_14720 [Pseudomonas fluvialis]|uniref:hypothetical protein n=1 Tax=Pseudomonas fluvialis TaxID=1793966 RepID=UPI000B8B3380|nr:hypothetical protein [Pseudomonas fluvialis]OXM39303.1 hypothetical protein CFY91_14720 [Pseudomonas fluvialis]